MRLLPLREHAMAYDVGGRHCPTRTDGGETMTENIRRTIEELKAMGLIVDSGRRRRNGQIVWITREQAEAEKLKIN